MEILERAEEMNEEEADEPTERRQRPHEAEAEEEDPEEEAGKDKSRPEIQRDHFIALESAMAAVASSASRSGRAASSTSRGVPFHGSAAPAPAPSAVASDLRENLSRALRQVQESLESPEACRDGSIFAGMVELQQLLFSAGARAGLPTPHHNQGAMVPNMPSNMPMMPPLQGYGGAGATMPRMPPLPPPTVQGGPYNFQGYNAGGHYSAASAYAASPAKRAKLSSNAVTPERGHPYNLQDPARALGAGSFNWEEGIRAEPYGNRAPLPPAAATAANDNAPTWRDEDTEELLGSLDMEPLPLYDDVKASDGQPSGSMCGFCA